jgi:SAM-dependent methyltransferase
MSWDATWDAVFSAREWGRYPPEELVRFVARTFRAVPDRGAVHVLELGCGPGANLWYTAREGFSVHGIDGSAVAVEQAGRRLADEGLFAEIVVGDFTTVDDHFPSAWFDLVLDVASLQCNRVDAVDRALAAAASVLKPGGRIFSMLLAEGSWGDGDGTELEPGTFLVAEGPAAGTGVSHFFTLEEVERLFSRFADVGIEYSERSLDDRTRVYRHWVVTGRRP